ncbi:MAG: prolyl oligopeptidase family serine peptidase [Candidatus Acidiferrales bacterium]
MTLKFLRASVAAAIWITLGFLAVPVRAAGDDKQATPAPGKTSWKAEDIIYQELAADFRVSPDGKAAAWVKSTGDKDKDLRVSNLYLSSLTEKKELQLTRGTDEVSHPRWSPSSDSIAFLSTRALPKPKPDSKPDGGSQIWLISASGGEPWALTELEHGVEQFEWIDNGTILFSAKEDPSLYERQTKERKDDSDVVDDAAHTAPVRLFRLSVKDKKITRVTENNDWIIGFEVSRDGKKAVVVERRELSYAWDQKTPPAVWIVDLITGERTDIFTDGKIRPDTIRWTRDGAGFYVVAPYSSDSRFLTATIRKVYFYEITSAATAEVNLDWDRAMGNSLQVTDDGFIALLADGVYTKAVRYTRHGTTWSRKSITGATDKKYSEFVLGDDGHTLLYEYSTASLPTQWYRARLDGAKLVSPVQITDLNPQFKNKTIARTEILHWAGANEEEVEGILYYPDNYEAGRRYPLIVATHGGPAGADHDRWEERMSYAPNLLTQRGAFILKTNYHGSSDYGLKWVESICCGKYYDLEIPDIERGVDSLVTKGLVNADQIGAMGWSNGSILSIQLTIVNPDRYKAASVGAGDVEWISDWANVDFGKAFDDYYFGKSPLEDPQLYIQKSPLFKMDRVKTPTLIFFGTIDRQVPTEEGWSHYRALYSIGKAPVKFILFPGEAHGPKKLSHQLRKLTEESAWFDTYLFRTKPSENEALKKGSPLGIAIERLSFQKSGSQYGIAWRPPSIPENPAPAVLLPEVVRRGDIDIGRFEITRAQYAAFDKEYKSGPGADNFPANGITFDQATAYCKWLSQLTAETYRLPKESEIGDLYKERAGENTLDYWAGYPLNPDDAQKLDAKIKELGEGAPLLREVGSFAGEGDEGEALIFDLAGNVAEWIVSADGSGKTVGGSADRPSDAKARYRSADPAYTGFRVVHELPKAPPAPANPVVK